MSEASVIAIDGPAASGKSTLALKLANALDYLYFDTGVMYRAVTYKALQQGLAHEAEAEISELAEGLEIDVQPASEDGRPYRVYVAGDDLTEQLRTPEVDANVSTVAMYPRVRQAMTARQREIGLRGQVVMVGRDIGTVVLPEADVKLYLKASVEARARRRWNEINEQGGNADYESILASMRERDRLDSTREIAPLRPAEDAHVLDTTELSIEETFRKALALARGEGLLEEN